MLSKFSVKKPYTIIVAIVLVLILGGVSYANMSVDLIPSINMPYAVVTTSYPGASPEEVEMAVTSPVEQSMASIGNIKEVSSVSSENYSMVILEFHQDANMDSAMLEMRESLDMLSSYLPDGAGSPLIMKINPDMMPIVSMSVSLDGKTDQESAKYIEDKILPEIESISGVASVSANGLIANMIDVTLSGEKMEQLNQKVAQFYQTQAEQKIRAAVSSEVQTQLDAQLAAQKAALLAKGMPAQAVENALASAKKQMQAEAQKQIDAAVQEQLAKVEIPSIDITKDMISGILSGQNFSMPSGSVTAEDGGSYLVRVGDKIKTRDELETLTLMNIPDYGAVTLSDVADITSYDNSGSMYSRVNGNYAVILSLQKQPDFSTADVANNVQDRIGTLMSNDNTLHFNVLMDQGEYVDIMIKTIMNNLVFGALLAILILILFLGKLRPTFIVAASIVISVIGAFVLMYFSGITLNMISMGGLALGVGMLVDNSIVVIENIFRFRSQGMSAREAAIEGAKEVSSAITASTLTTVIVFLPIVFTQGLTRQIFTDMALTIAYSLLASLVVALTLVPAASSKMLDKKFAAKAGWSDKLAVGYAKLLDKSLRHKWVTIGMAVILLVVSMFAAFSSGTELFPAMNSGSITVSVEMPDQYSQEQTYQELDGLYEKLSTIEDVETIGILNSGSGSGAMSMMSQGTTVYVQLKENHTRSTEQVIEEIRTKTQDSSYEVTAQSSNMDLSMLSGGQVVLQVYGRELDVLRQAAQEVADLVAGVEGTTEIDNGLGKNSQELRISVDKDAAIAKGLTVAQVYQAVSKQLASNKVATTITDGGLDYDIYVKDNRENPLTEADLASLSISLPDGSAILLSEVAKLEKADGFTSIRRTSQDRYVSVTASLKEGYNVGKVNEAIQNALREYTPPEGCRVEQAGENEMMQSTFRDLLLMIVLAIIFIYLVMVAQFQSLLSPFIVMFTIPLAFTGGFLALFLTGLPISVVSLIGFVVLIGIVVNNGIVFVDYTNQQMAKGRSKHEALLLAGKTRLRPILMTALTTIIALCTMAFDSSSGGELLRPMAITTIGGMIYSTLLTLFLVPSMYAIFHKEKKKGTTPLLEENASPANDSQ